MVKVKLFTKSYCPYCHRALDLLKELGADVENIEVDNGNEEWETEKEKQEQRHTTVPMIFIGDKFIGGSDELQELNNSGKLKEMLK